MAEVALGIDIGTSYIKAAARREDGTIVRVSRIDSSQLWSNGAEARTDAYLCWTRVNEVLRGLLFGQASSRHRVTAICVSGIAPMLTLFDASDRTRTCSIPYFSLAEMPDGSALSQTDRTLTDRRVRVLRRVAEREGFIIPRITDLIGYLNWCLTGEVTINSISLAEMGMLTGEADCDALSVKDGLPPQLVAPSQHIGEVDRSSAAELGVEVGIPVCGGCPDTMASVVGAGVECASETMLYLGTFGSLLRLETDLDELLDVPRWSGTPFHWTLSVPGLGQKIEALSQDWFGPGKIANLLHKLDLASTRSDPGAGGSLFLLPRWRNSMKAVGTFSFVPGRDGEVGDISRRSRAVLESLGYAILIVDGISSKTIKVSGGGARSGPWLEELSTVLGVNILVQNMAWEAAGTADIAARLVWGGRQTSRTWRTAERIVDSDRQLIEENLFRTRELYHSWRWI